jgi:hypothetical protein
MSSVYITERRKIFWPVAHENVKVSWANIPDTNVLDTLCERVNEILHLLCRTAADQKVRLPVKWRTVQSRQSSVHYFGKCAKIRSFEGSAKLQQLKK